MLKKLKNIFAGQTSTDIAFRYLPVVDLIKKYQAVGDKILEIGSGDTGITPYYPGQVIGVDIAFEQPGNSRLKKIKIKGPAFPFGDDEFNLAICVDTLEHIRLEERTAYLKEIFRVTKKFFILELPVGSLAYEHDKELGDYFFKIHQTEDRFIREHLTNTLPSASDLLSALQLAAAAAGKKIEIGEQAKIFNLKLRLVLMKFKISRSRFKKIIYYCFLPLARYYRIFSYGECYRRLFFIKIN